MTLQIKNFLLELGRESDLRFDLLIKFIEDNNLPISDIGINGAPAMCSQDDIYVDLEKCREHEDDKVFFLILHEASHYLRFRKKGGNYSIDLYQELDYGKFFKNVMYEEEFANKLASIIYYRFNNESFDLDQIDFEKYEYAMKPLHSAISNGMTYENMLKIITYPRVEEKNSINNDLQAVD